MEGAGIVHFNRKSFVSVIANGKSQNERSNEIINLIALELRTPVTVMKSNIQFLKKFCIGNDQTMVDESFSFCEEAADNILRFINCVHFLSDSDQGKFPLKKLRFNLFLFMNQLMEELKQSNAEVSRIQIDMDVSNSQIITDKYLLNRIIINLLENALKFSRSKVELSLSEANNQLTVVVRDMGIGIPAHEIAEVFHPFGRASNVKMISGTGLGLSIVSKAVECLEGDVFVNSVVGEGTEIRLVIPLEPYLKMNPKVEKSNHLIPQL